LAEEHSESFGYRQFNATFVETAIHVGFIGLLAYWCFLLISPFLPIIVWSIVLTVALYPLYDWLAAVFRGRRRLAAASITIAGLLVVIGPVAWLGLGLIDGLELLLAQLRSGKLVPPPSQASVIIAGFLFSPGPRLVITAKTLALKLDSKHGEEFVEIAGATIRTVSRG
jgi:hypothetical protein